MGWMNWLSIAALGTGIAALVVSFGIPGPVGPEGPMGPQGTQGEQGGPGVQGPQGLEGSIGPAGQDGQDAPISEAFVWGHGAVSCTSSFSYPIGRIKFANVGDETAFNIVIHFEFYASDGVGVGFVGGTLSGGNLGPMLESMTEVTLSLYLCGDLEWWSDLDVTFEWS